MKLVLAAIVAGMLVFGTAACAKQEPKKEVSDVKTSIEPIVVTPAAVAVEEKKVAEPKKTKRVCIEQKDAKTGKVKEVCRTIKIHKKFEGTKVPEKAPKKK
jgi:hypothetical protein